MICDIINPKLRNEGILMMIGEKIKELRKRNGMTQEKLAEKLCISYQSVSKWECGQSSPDLSLILPLTRIFGVSADELLGITEADDDLNRKRYDTAMRKYRNDSSVSYWWAREAVSAYPKDYNYLEWLAYAEYRLAFDENKSDNPSREYFNELTDNSLRRFEYLIENCADTDVYSRAVLGKIMVLRFLDRTDEADWSAEFEYPDINIKNGLQALSLFEAGRELLSYLDAEARFNPMFT